MTDLLVRRLLIVLLASLGSAAAQTLPIATRGELLYSAHCIACHSSQVHWRAKKLARDWPSLQAEVRRWQKLAQLGWGEDDVVEVARYLNARYYRFAAAQPG